MAAIPEMNVDLSAPPEERWAQLGERRDAGRALLAFYVRDLGGMQAFAPLLDEYCSAYVDAEYLAEMRGVARALDAPHDEVILANLYYDAMKLVLCGGMGCTAFGVDTANGPLHARNLDWTTASGDLASESIVVNFSRGNGVPLYRTVGWPGFVGCFSGVAPGRFAVSLNAVISEDPPQLAPPITFLLRRTLERAAGYEAAVAALRDSTVASDSLLLVTGARDGEMTVIERAPTRAAVRGPHDGAVFVTNDYRALAMSAVAGPTEASELARTSCGRFQRTEELVREAAPEDAAACLRILRDARIRMGITVQHLVFSARSGAVTVALPS